MPVTKFHSIYRELKQRIITQEYKEMLPTENLLTKEFHTSRNTIRRAIALLNEEGYVYSVKGRGVLILESFDDQRWLFGASNFKGLKAILESNDLETDTKVVSFRKIIVTKEDHVHLPFSDGEVLYQIERIRYLNKKATMLDHSYFRVDHLPDLSKETAQSSIYSHLAKNDVKIVAAKRRFLVTSATEHDVQMLDLGVNNCVGVAENLVFNDLGKLFEYTQSRFVPDYFSLDYFVQNTDC